MGRRAKKIRAPHEPSGGGPERPRTGSRSTVAAVCGLLLLAVIAVFGQTAGHDFVNFDDDDYVYANRHVLGGLSDEGIAWAFTAYRSWYWHPLTWLSHMADCQLYGLKPGGHHLTSVLLHAAAAVLLLLALRRMTRALWPSAWAAAVFAIHPLRAESVAWVAERKDVLSGLLFMSTLWLYARYVQRPASWGRYWAVLASFALGLTAKPMLVTLPLVLLLLDYWPLGRFSQRWLAVIAEKIPLLLLAAASCLVTLAAQRDGVQPLEQLAFPGRVANAAVAYVAYLGKMLCPAGLAIYPLPQGPPPAWEVVAAVAVLLAISAAVFVVRRKCPYLLFGWLWYLGTLVPVIGLVQVGNQAMADRYTYLTQIGLYLAMAWGAAQAAGRWRHGRWALAAVAALLAAGCTACAWQQTCYWRDSETLWTHTLACTRQNPIAQNNLGSALAQRGQVDGAMAHYQRALEIKPDSVEAHVNLGNALAGRGRVDEAVAHYLKALEINPGFESAHYNLGLALAGRGQLDEAIVHFRKALRIRPDFELAHNNLGLALAHRGQVEEAMAHYRTALQIRPDFEMAHCNLGLALAGRGQLDEAMAHFRKALETRPDYLEAHYGLGLALADRGRVEEALAHFQKALGLASARNDTVLAETIRARIGPLQKKSKKE
jgi:tetratricopeptide (TPR) repeat protein